MLGGTAPFASSAALSSSLPAASPLSFFAPPKPLVFGAQFAPLSHPLAPGAPPPQHSAAFWARYLRRGFALSQWDLDYVCYQLINSCRAPAQVYKLTLHRKQTKNQWARDDPSFAGVLLGLLAVVAVAYGVAYRYTSPLAYAWLVAHFWGGFLGTGLAAASAGWAAANRFARVPAGAALPHAVEQSVEWLFAWDIHCNAFVPVLLLVYVAHFLLLPLVMAGDGLVPCLAGNALYAAAAAHYLYITFQGYLVLPFLQHDKLRPLLGAIIAVVVLGVAATLLHINVAAWLLGLAIE